MKNVAVTGATGFIGQHLVDRLLKMDSVDKVFIFVKDYGRVPKRWLPMPAKLYMSPLFNLLEYGKYLKHYVAKCDTIFHLAANPIVKDDDLNPTDISRDNILATHCLLSSAPSDCRFIFASSATVYGNQNTAFGCSESFPLLPNSIYGATKVASEALVHAYTKIGKVRGTSLRLVANVGAGVTHGVVRDFIRKLQSDSPTLDILGDCPGSTKPFCHVSSTVSAMIVAATHDNWNFPAINISPTTRLNCEQLAYIVMKETGLAKPIKWLGETANWNGDNRLVNINNNLALMLGWSPRFNSQQAVIQGVKDILAESSLTETA